MPVLDFQSTYILMAIMEEVIPETFFFKDRYFPTEAGDIFNADKVLTEYRKGDRRMAAFVSSRIGDIPVERRGFEIHEYQPSRIAPSRMLTIDELNKRGFGEAIYPGSDEAERAARLIRDDLQTLEQRIKRREEWMSAETMINNACTMQEYVDAKNGIAGSLNAETGFGIMGPEIDQLYGKPDQSSLTPDGEYGTIQETSEMGRLHMSEKQKSRPDPKIVARL